METPVQYGEPQVEIRKECLVAFKEGWQQPTGDEVRAVLKMTGLSGKEAADMVGLENTRIVRKWAGGAAPVPYSVWAILCERAGFGMIWKG